MPGVLPFTVGDDKEVVNLHPDILLHLGSDIKLLLSDIHVRGLVDGLT